MECRVGKVWSVAGGGDLVVLVISLRRSTLCKLCGTQ